MLSRLAALFGACCSLWRFRRVFWQGKSFFDDAKTNGPVFRDMLVQSGPFYIKLGQWLSQRPDLIPRDFVECLKSLQHDAPHHSFEVTRACLQDAVARYSDGTKSVEDVFSDVEQEPMASGSIAQVHFATLRASESPTGEPCRCVVKVRHPGIVERLDTDLRQIEALFAIGKLLGFHLCLVIDIDSVMKEMRAQCWLSREVRAMREFRTHFEDSQNVVFPEPLLWDDDDQVIVETIVQGVRFEKVPKSESEAGSANDTTRMGCKRLTMAAYIHMLLVDGLIHGDCHDGNILYDVRPRTDVRAMRADRDLSISATFKASEVGTSHAPDLYQCARTPDTCVSSIRVAFVDFGITVRIGREQRESLIELLIASHAKDPQRGVQVIRHLVVSQNGTNDLSASQLTGLEQFSSDYAALLDAMHSDESSAGISRILHETLNLLRAHELRIDGNLVRVLVNFILIEEDCPSDRDNNLFDETLTYILFEDENGDFDALMEPVSEFFGNNFAMRRLESGDRSAGRSKLKNIKEQHRSIDESVCHLENCIAPVQSKDNYDGRRRRRRNQI